MHGIKKIPHILKYYIYTAFKTTENYYSVINIKTEGVILMKEGIICKNTSECKEYNKGWVKQFVKKKEFLKKNLDVILTFLERIKLI